VWRGAQKKACPKLSTGAGGNSEKISPAIETMVPTLTGKRRRREGGKHGQRRTHEDIALPDLQEKVAPKRNS